MFSLKRNPQDSPERLCEGFGQIKITLSDISSYVGGADAWKNGDGDESQETRIGRPKRVEE
jgi:hypothetical protein